MKVKLLLFFCLLFAGVASAESANFSGMLIQASSQAGGVDPELSGIQDSLKKFPYKSFKFAGRGGKNIDIPGKSSFKVGASTVDVQAKSAAGGKVTASIQWKVGGKTAINTTVSISKGSGTILGGPRSGDGVLILYFKVK